MTKFTQWVGNIVTLRIKIFWGQNVWQCPKSITVKNVVGTSAWLKKLCSEKYDEITRFDEAYCIHVMMLTSVRVKWKRTYSSLGVGGGEEGAFGLMLYQQFLIQAEQSFTANSVLVWIKHVSDHHKYAHISLLLPHISYVLTFAIYKCRYVLLNFLFA
jgi:hypothetical protein